jgi:hypothetical protein
LLKPVAENDQSIKGISQPCFFDFRCIRWLAATGHRDEQRVFARSFCGLKFDRSYSAHLQNIGFDDDNVLVLFQESIFLGNASSLTGSPYPLELFRK